ncbi:hypothetical protein [Bryobacter aggregatus]|uniref:hypothetical protein n=1 Tax=Bryobacter aggregatus TaxID=360054 RepID=UPI0004E1F13A|nr:hypothetical protein [Bryobacter aggregatus]
MAIDPTIALNTRGIDLSKGIAGVANAYDQAADNKLRRESMRQTTELHGAQMRNIQAQEEERRRKQARETELRQAMERGATPEQITAIDPETGLKLAEDKRKADLSALDQQIKKLEVAKKQAGAFASLVGGMTEQNYHETVGRAVSMGVIPPEVGAKYFQMPWTEVQGQLPALQKQALDANQQIELGFKEAEEARNAAEHKAKLPGMAADSNLKIAESQGQRPIQPAEQARLNQLSSNMSATKLAMLAAKGDPDALKAMDLITKQHIAARPPASPGIQLSSDAVNMLASNVAAGGQMPNLGRNAGGAIGQVLNTAAASNPSINLAGARAGNKADSASLTNLQKQQDAITAFENTAGKNLDQFLETAKGVIDTGSPALNLPIRMVTEKLVGSDKMTAFHVARQVAVTEIAKVLSNPGGNAVLSDSARHEVQQLIGPNATLKQIYRAAEILRRDMRNRHESNEDQLKEIRGRIGSGGGGASLAPQSAPNSKRKPLAAFEGSK